MQTWPTALPLLSTNSQDSRPANVPQQTAFANGRHRVRQRTLSTDRIITGALQLTRAESVLLNDFFKQIDYGHDWFLCPVKVGTGVQLQTVKWLPPYSGEQLADTNAVLHQMTLRVRNADVLSADLTDLLLNYDLLDLERAASAVGRLNTWLP